MYLRLKILFQEHTSIQKFIRQCYQYIGMENQHKVVPYLEETDINTFLLEADNSDRYLLVRKVLAIFFICGQQKSHELRNLDLTNVLLIPDVGFQIQYYASKTNKDFEDQLITHK